MLKLSLSDWAVLAALAEAPTHGFRLSARFAQRGDFGFIWTVQRPQVYRALERLEKEGLAEAAGIEPGESGPPRLRYAATEGGQRAVARWLFTPVTHLRDARSELLLKLVFLERQQLDPAELIAAQLELFRKVQHDYRVRLETATGAEHLALLWRLEMAEAARRFLENRLDVPLQSSPNLA